MPQMLLLARVSCEVLRRGTYEEYEEPHCVNNVQATIFIAVLPFLTQQYILLLVMYKVVDSCSSVGHIWAKPKIASILRL